MTLGKVSEWFGRKTEFLLCLGDQVHSYDKEEEYAAFGTPPGDDVLLDAKMTPSAPLSLIGNDGGIVAGVSAKLIYEPQAEPRYLE